MLSVVYYIAYFNFFESRIFNEANMNTGNCTKAKILAFNDAAYRGLCLQIFP